LNNPVFAKYVSSSPKPKKKGEKMATGILIGLILGSLIERGFGFARQIVGRIAAAVPKLLPPKR